MENYQEIAPVKDREALKKAGVYITPKTLRKWHCLGINPQLFLSNMFILGGAMLSKQSSITTMTRPDTNGI